MRTTLILVTIIALSVGGWFIWPYFPGTFYRDAQGQAHGTGEYLYHYKNGAIKLKEWYRAGRQMKSIWYAPDGTVIQETHWINESGEGIHVREDGSIKARMHYVNGRSHGTVTYYREDGSVERTEEHRNGAAVVSP